MFKKKKVKEYISRNAKQQFFKRWRAGIFRVLATQSTMRCVHFNHFKITNNQIRVRRMWEEATVFRRNSYRHMVNMKTPHRKAPFDLNPGPSCVQATLLTTEPARHSKICSTRWASIHVLTRKNQLRPKIRPQRTCYVDVAVRKMISWKPSIWAIHVH